MKTCVHIQDTTDGTTIFVVDPSVSTSFLVRLGLVPLCLTIAAMLLMGFSLATHAAPGCSTSRWRSQPPRLSPHTWPCNPRRSAPGRQRTVRRQIAKC